MAGVSASEKATRSCAWSAQVSRSRDISKALRLHGLALVEALGALTLIDNILMQLTEIRVYLPV